MVLKALDELLILELRRELRKRELSDKGRKSELVDRLRTSLENNGFDPEEYEFEVENELLKALNKMAEENRAAHRAAQQERKKFLELLNGDTNNCGNKKDGQDEPCKNVQDEPCKDGHGDEPCKDVQDEPCKDVQHVEQHLFFL